MKEVTRGGNGAVTTHDSNDEPSGVLKHIDPADLTVEGGKPAGIPDSSGGYDPYNQGKTRPKLKK